MQQQYGLVYVTASSMQEAKKLAQICVNKKLCACVNIFPPILSCYTWQDEYKETEETVFIMKTRENLFEALSAEIKKHHSYECPCIIFIPILKGEVSFLKWIKNHTTII